MTAREISDEIRSRRGERRQPRYPALESRALQVERAQYARQILVRIRNVRCVRAFLLISSAHDGSNRGRGRDENQSGALMLDRPHRQGLAAPWKSRNDMMVDNGSGDNDDKARRFRDAALPHLDDVYTLARYLLRDGTDAEDAVQECYLRALRHFDTYRGPAMKPWLFAILRNVCRSEFARRSGGLLTMDGETDEEEAVPLWHEGSVSPEAEMLRQWDAKTVRRLVAELPDPFREAIVLREINDLSYSEIADVVGVPVGTVMSRLARARSILRKAWIAQEGSPT